MSTIDPQHLERIRSTLRLALVWGPSVDTSGLTEDDEERVAEALADVGLPSAQVLDRDLYAQALLQGVAIALLPERPPAVWIQLLSGRGRDWIEEATAEPLLEDDVPPAVAA